MARPDGKLANKVAVVTGGNGGIGLATARLFAAEGAKLAIFGRNRETLDAARGELGDDCLAVAGDLLALDDLDRLYAEVRGRFGAIDCLVANAGGAAIRPVGDIDEAFFDREVGITLKGTFFTIQKALPLLRDGGTIVVVSSISATKAFPGLSLYGASKAALRSLVRTLTAELAPRRIRVNALTPGAIDTQAYQRLGMTEDQIAAMKVQQEAATPLGRMGKADEIARAALFLASSDSSYMAGAELTVDGGVAQI
ncbi:MAG: SDR family oxidoreductase [Alphaproteobacteria bacterium]